MKFVIVGCGNIAERYADHATGHPNIEIAGFFDIDAERARAFSAEHGGRAYGTLDEVIADDSVQGIVNLTIFDAHYDVVSQALAGGKHVYSEKPLALKYSEAVELVELAKQNDRYLSCSPFVFLQEAQQTAMKWVRGGRLGRVRLIYAEVNHGRIETWHPNPVPFYSVGPNLDVGVYPLSVATALLGPVERLSAFATTLHSKRRTKDGKPFSVDAPDFYVINLEFTGGEVMRLTTNFYVSSRTRQGEGMEFHGDAGSLFLESWMKPDSHISYADYGEEYAPIEAHSTNRNGVDWSRGLVEFAESIRERRRSRMSAEHAAHIVEILEATNTAVSTGKRVELASTFTVPDPLTETQ